MARTRRFNWRAFALLVIAVAVTGGFATIIRSRAGNSAGPPNDSSIFGVPPSELTVLPPAKQTSLASNLATRAVQLQTPVPTPVHPNVYGVLPWAGPIPTPVGTPQIVPALSLGDAGSGMWYTPRNGWVGYVGGLTIYVYAGAAHSQASVSVGVTSLVVVRKWSLDGNPVSFENRTPATNIGPLHVVSFDANDVLVLQSDDGQSSVFFDPLTGQFLNSPSEAPTPRPNPTSTPTPIPGVPRIRVAEPVPYNGRIQVPVVAEGSGYADYGGFSLHLRWDPSVFHFVGADSIWGEFQDADCPSAVVDGDGAGAVFGCSGQRELTNSGVLSTQGLLATLVLQPVGTGCSALHLVPPQSGAASTPSTYTIDATTGGPQTAAYLDAAVDQDGQGCTPAPSVAPS